MTIDNDNPVAEYPVCHPHPHGDIHNTTLCPNTTSLLFSLISTLMGVHDLDLLSAFVYMIKWPFCATPEICISVSELDSMKRKPLRE